MNEANEKTYCQVPGCHRYAQTTVEIDLPLAWEATREYTTLTAAAGFCQPHGHDVTGRVQAMLEARTEFADLVAIIEAAVRYEKSLQLRLEAQAASAREPATAIAGPPQWLGEALNSGAGSYRP